MVETIKQGEFTYLLTLLNGDDYYGKFLLRCLSDERTLIRCDAGISRFSIDGDGTIYPCSVLSVDKSNIVKTNPNDNLYRQLTNNIKLCNKCKFNYICGGECLAVLKEHKHKDNVMCFLKKKLIKLAIYLAYVIRYETELETKLKINSFVENVLKRNFKNESIYGLLENNNSLTFVEAKEIVDNGEV